jgi:hypothetical protein
VGQALGHAAIDARGDIDPRGVRLALDQQRLRLDQVPERQADDHGDGKRDDNGGGARRAR